MNIVEATVHNLQSAKGVFLALKHSNPNLKWLLVTTAAYATICNEIYGRGTPLQNTISIEFEDQDGVQHRMNITYSQSVIDSYNNYEKLKNKGFTWVDP